MMLELAYTGKDNSDCNSRGVGSVAKNLWEKVAGKENPGDVLSLGSEVKEI